MATEETQNDNAERDSLTEEPVMVNFDPSNDDQPEQVPPPIPNDTNPNQTESKQDTENEENDESLEVDYDNPISIPLAVPTDSVRSLMFDTYSIPQKPGPNISAMVNASNNYNQSLPPPQPQPDKDENQTENDDNTSNLPPPAPSNDEPDPPPSIPPPYQNEDEQDEDEEDPYIPEENELPHNATTHNAIFDLDFDTNINAIIINIKDEVTGKSWKMELTEEESTNGQSIREEYAKLGQTLSTGKCQYIYPPNNSRDPITVTVSNDDNEYTYTVPDSRAPKKPKKKNDIDPEGTPESEQQDNDDNDVIVDTLVPTKKTPGIDDNTSPGPTPPPPQPPNTFGINIENIDVKEDRYFISYYVHSVSIGSVQG